MEYGKPLLSVEEQINHLKKKGITFLYIDEIKAKKYLSENNNFYKLYAYRKNYEKNKSNGQYLSLDFAMLKDLAILDMRLRYIIIQMALDIEHFLKVKLIHEVEMNNEDGYQIVQDYWEFLKTEVKDGVSKYDILSRDMAIKKKSEYCGAIIQKYENHYPVWAFIEVVSLGTFIEFYKFCANRFNNKNMLDDYYLMKSVKDIRNAAAHNSCILNDLRERNNKYKTNYCVTRQIATIPKGIRNRRLSNDRMKQLVTLLYTHARIVTSNGVHEHVGELLRSFYKRINQNIEYYRSNELLLSDFKFLGDCIDIFFL